MPGRKKPDPSPSTLTEAGPASAVAELPPPSQPSPAIPGPEPTLDELLELVFPDEELFEADEIARRLGNAAALSQPGQLSTYDIVCKAVYGNLLGQKTHDRDPNVNRYGFRGDAIREWIAERQIPVERGALAGYARSAEVKRSQAIGRAKLLDALLPDSHWFTPPEVSDRLGLVSPSHGHREDLDGQVVASAILRRVLSATYLAANAPPYVLGRAVKAWIAAERIQWRVPDKWEKYRRAVEAGDQADLTQRTRLANEAAQQAERAEEVVEAQRAWGYYTRALLAEASGDGTADTGDWAEVIADLGLSADDVGADRDAIGTMVRLRAALATDHKGPSVGELRTQRKDLERSHRAAMDELRRAISRATQEQNRPTEARGRLDSLVRERTYLFDGVGEDGLPTLRGTVG